MVLNFRKNGDTERGLGRVQIGPNWFEQNGVDFRKTEVLEQD